MDSLTAFSDVPDEKVSLGEAALLLASVFHPDISLERYRHHIQKVADEVGVRFKELLDAGAEDNPGTRLAALKHVLADKHGYEGDVERPNHIQNADLIRVIDRGKGGPVVLSILYIETALAQGWEVYGLDIPGYFAVRLDQDGQRLIFDPFKRCSVLQAPDLRKLVKDMLGEHAELSASYYEPVTRRAILMRLQNHIKLRQIESEDYHGALQSVEAMRVIDPGEFRLLLDAGVLYARTDQPRAAIDALEDYIKKAPDARDRQEAAILLQEIKHTLD